MEDFLQRTGGQYGGWDQFDHQTFLKVSSQITLSLFISSLTKLKFSLCSYVGTLGLDKALQTAFLQERGQNVPARHNSGGYRATRKLVSGAAQLKEQKERGRDL